jgi:hypothetical protein
LGVRLKEINFKSSCIKRRSREPAMQPKALRFCRMAAKADGCHDEFRREREG